MTRMLLRMGRDTAFGPDRTPGVEIRPWDPSRDHARIPEVYGEAFGHDPWADDWDGFDGFDPGGVFVADGGDGPVGFCICFPRGGEGYISVVAVLPAYRRRRIASALVGRAVARFRSLGLTSVGIDAYEDAAAAVGTYRSLGFRVVERVEDPDADPRGSAEE